MTVLLERQYQPVLRKSQFLVQRLYLFRRSHDFAPMVSYGFGSFKFRREEVTMKSVPSNILFVVFCAVLAAVAAASAFYPTFAMAMASEKDAAEDKPYAAVEDEYPTGFGSHRPQSTSNTEAEARLQPQPRRAPGMVAPKMRCENANCGCGSVAKKD